MRNNGSGCLSASFNQATQKKVLIVDDESIVRWSLKKFFEEEGFAAVTVSSGAKAIKSFEETVPDVVLMDIQLPDANGMALLKTIKEINPGTPVIMITGYADIRSSVEAMKVGALDYLVKPLDFDDLRRVMSSLKKDRQGPGISGGTDDFVFVSEKMREVVRIMERLATRSDATVLILGESGTGKNLLCKKMHELSPRRTMPFVEIGCANIPEHLIESELFGYEKGAFTDAKASKKGLIEMAEGGTIFLDEIGDMPYQMQPKILSLIEEKKCRRLGGLDYINADVRICAATNRNLMELVEARKFRLDLFYRLNVATVEMPPLRERSEDIPPLVRHFLDYYCRKYECPRKEMTQRALNLLREYRWPGNVRELKNLIEKLVIMTKGEEIDLNDIPLNAFAPKTTDMPKDLEIPDMGSHSGLALKAMEEAFIKTALKLADGNQRKAARLLDISRDTLRYRLKKLGIQPAE